MSRERVIAYFDVQGKDCAIHGTICTKFSDKSHQVYYELHTDNPVPLQVRDQEIKLKAQRTTTMNNSLFVRTDQCALENPIIQANDPPPPKLPPNHPTAHTGAVTTQRRARFILGDLVTLPLDGKNGLINGTVGYCGIHSEREVIELCANSTEYRSAFICGLRHKYEVPDFPDHLRHHDMKGFSLVVDAKSVIPHDGSLVSPTDFSQTVSSRMNPDPYHSGYPRKSNIDHGRSKLLLQLKSDFLTRKHGFDCATLTNIRQNCIFAPKIFLFLYALARFACSFL